MYSFNNARCQYLARDLGVKSTRLEPQKCLPYRKLTRTTINLVHLFSLLTHEQLFVYNSLGITQKYPSIQHKPRG